MSFKKLALFLGPLFFVLIYFFAPAGDEVSYTVLGVAAWMLIWWLTETVNLAVTALLPLLLFPIFKVMPIKMVAANYAHPIVYLFFGGFILALALEKWNLHQRLALNIIKATGTKSHQVLLGFMLATAFLSMWISNTATTVMMLPIVLSVIALFDNTKHIKKLSFILLIGIAWAANIGGIATLIGTPPNLILAGYLKDHLNQEIYFSNWLIVGFPVAVVLLFVAYFILNKMMPKTNLSESENIFTNKLKALGAISTAEKRVAVVFVLTALAWVFRPVISKINGLEGISDTGIALFCAISLFVIPSGMKKGKAILQWKDTRKLSWGILILFGGGMALANGLNDSGTLDIISNTLSKLNLSNVLVIVFIMALVGVFVTELVSNMALVAAILPLVAVVASSFNLPFIQLALPVTIGASCAFMLPTATPPNAIVFSSGKINIPEMAKVGLLMNVVAVFVITAIVYGLALFVL